MPRKSSKTKAKPKSKKKTPVKAKKQKIQKPLGTVTHFFGNIKVAVVKFKKPVKTGTSIHFKGATTDFIQTIDSMQYNHLAIKSAKKNQSVGLKVKKRVREGDSIYDAE